jgi:hypothetical protein
MKKLLIVLVLVAFALAPAVQAGEGKDSAKSKAKTANAKADKAKVAECVDTAKSDLTACATACCEKSNLTKKTVKPAEKGGMLLAKR